MRLILLFSISSLLLAWAAASEPSVKDYERLRELGQNPRNGPNLLGRTNLFHKTRHAQKKTGSSARAVEDYLLPSDVEPVSYEVQLIPYLQNSPVPGAEFTFDGRVDIKILADRPTSTVVLHAEQLNILNIGVTQDTTGLVVPVIDWNLVTDDRHFLTINLAESLLSGQEYHLNINFTGILNSEGYGFFRSRTTDENGNTGWVATTQFESVGARRSFPCFDEPASKATFTIILAQEPGYTAVANMPLESTYTSPELPAGWTFAKFLPSPRMSSYLVAFTTSNYARLESTKDSRFAVWALSKDVQKGEYANDIAPDHFNYYQTYTNTDYGMPKVDQLAYQDFFSGAMENWGHISYVEDLLLWDPATGSQASKQLATQVISHELTHQWFGDIVSPLWWSDLWLNEGFATYFEFYATGELNPDWLMDQQFQTDNTFDAFDVDAFAFFSHPVHADVDSPASIDGIFDTMSYNKGGCLVKFMLNLLGPTNFRSGIIDYMTKMAYGAAHQNDLFASLEPHVPAGILPDGVTLAQVMDTFTLQEGVPAVTVIRDYATGTAQVSQTRFSVSTSEQWLIPLTLTTQSELNFANQVPKSWLLTAESSIGSAEGIPADNEWIIVNIQQTGYYRVNYDQTNWDLLFAYLNDIATADLIDPLNRAQILDDSLAFGITKQLNYKTALSSTLYLRHEKEYGPWAAALRRLEFIRDRMYQTPETASLFNKYLSTRLDNVFQHVSGLSVDSAESHATSITRNLISKWACNTGLESCNQQGQALLKQWQSTVQPHVNNPLKEDIKSVAYCAGMRFGNLEDFNFLMSQYASAKSASEQTKLLGALGCATDASILQRYLEETIRQPASVIRAGDALSVFFSVYSNPIGTELALDFLIENYSELKNIMNVGLALAGISEKLNTQSHYEKIVVFMQDHMEELSLEDKAFFASALTNLSKILDWNADHLAEVMLFFVENQP
ncbi:aminopeptidase N-like [Cloeon dipterum]|uniref:aminopeptidase N-like n=1 Tax=Cloeon dipterum TaxID=197152 RepID=UPI00321FF5C3